MASQPEVTGSRYCFLGQITCSLELFLHEYVGVSQAGTAMQASVQEVEAGDGVRLLIYNRLVSC